LLVALPCFSLAAIGSGRVIVFVLTTGTVVRSSVQVVFSRLRGPSSDIF
jgi:hypothetical protein